MTLEEVRLRAFLKERFVGYSDEMEIDDSIEGIVDSIGMFELVTFIEQEFEVSIPNTDFSPRLFVTIGSILKVIEIFRA